MCTILVAPCASFLQSVVMGCVETAIVHYGDISSQSNIFLLLQTVTRIERLLEEQKKAKVYAAVQHLGFALNHLTCDLSGETHKEPGMGLRDVQMQNLIDGAIRKDSKHSALTYFEECVKTAMLALHETPPLEDRLLLVEVMSVSQLLSEDLAGAKKNIFESLIRLSRHEDVSAVYYDLCYQGCSATSRQVALAKSMFRLHYYFRTLLGVIPSHSDALEVKVARSAYHPQGADQWLVDPLDPPMLIRSALRQSGAGAKLVATGVTALPLSIGAGMAVSGVSLALSPIAIPYVGLTVLERNRNQRQTWARYWEETYRDFKDCMHNLATYLASPVLFPHRVLGQVLSKEVGKQGLLQWQDGQAVLIEHL